MTGVPAVLDSAGAGESAGQVVETGDREYFDQFVGTRWPGLVRLAYGLTGDRWLAEDLAQTALANAYAAWWRVRRADDPDAYVRRILINACNSRFRRHRVSELCRGMTEFAQSAMADPASVVDDRSALLTALGELPARQRAVIVLRYWEDLTDAQVGAVLGCSASTVRSQTARALAKLRCSAALTDAGPGVGPVRRR
jgi:RNA polymerase sigma-70 factor (sigma-E family)